MSIPSHCYLFDFMLFYCFQILIIIEDLEDVVKFNQIKEMIKSEFLQ